MSYQGNVPVGKPMPLWYNLVTIKSLYIALKTLLLCYTAQNFYTAEE